MREGIPAASGERARCHPKEGNKECFSMWSLPSRVQQVTFQRRTYTTNKIDCADEKNQKQETSGRTHSKTHKHLTPGYQIPVLRAADFQCELTDERRPKNMDTQCRTTSSRRYTHRTLDIACPFKHHMLTKNMSKVSRAYLTSVSS